jgi:hypothetical protein
MLSLELARKLAAAGLDWMPQERDAFVIPDAGMDQRIFIISDLQATVQPYFGVKHIIFHGSSEWALDNVLVEDAVWMPSETQLRMAIEDRAPDMTYMLEKHADGYRCTLAGASGKGAAYPSAEDAYAVALLALLGTTTSAA